jgi:predicted  nucleic acid-binding Zn-ribbon protein
MASPQVKKALGILLVFVAVIGMLLAVAGLVQVWRLQARLSERAVASLALTADTLENTSAGLEILASSLDSTAASLQTLQTTTVSASDTISDTMLVLDSTATMLTSGIPATITAVQSSLATAEQGAGVIDDVLRILSGIPFISDVDYNPQTPLDQSIAEISASLEAIPEALQDTGEQLTNAGANLSGFEDSMVALSEQLVEIEADLNDMQGVVENYQDILDTANTAVGNLQRDVPVWIQRAAWVATLVLIWFGFAQLGPLLQGWGIYQANRRS